MSVRYGWIFISTWNSTLTPTSQWACMLCLKKNTYQKIFFQIFVTNQVNTFNLHPTLLCICKRLYLTDVTIKSKYHEHTSSMWLMLQTNVPFSCGWRVDSLILIIFLSACVILEISHSCRMRQRYKWLCTCMPPIYCCFALSALSV